MRLVSQILEGAPAAGVLVGEEIVPTAALGAPASVRELLRTLDAGALQELGERAASSSGPRTPLASATLAPPIPDPQKIICIGLNYRDHAEESGQEIPQAPMWFAKFQNSLIGSGAPIVLPAAHPEYVDYEAEMALVIGREGHAIPEAQALAHVAGVMPFNDVSARDLQLQNPLWTSGKAIDTFAPCGPAMVTLDALGDLGELVLRTRINGEQFQQGTTANLIFGPAELVAWLSRTMTLLPGDIIATGTPAGVGGAQGRFLRDGDTVEVELEGIGTVANPVRAE
jgi:2-keto-4-pentenoate hydratase/2-oxohepta-3-ene-1,7-dioic acid hydratase in catechol pathway